jgi:cell division transport system ATP-binding protein
VIVNDMRKRVIELVDGVLVRDEAEGIYIGAQGDNK